MEFTRIDRTNITFFSNLLPEDQKADDGRVLLGIIEEETPCAAAVLTIGTAADLSWIYTAPEYRRLGAASILMEEIRDLIEGTGVTGITASYFSTMEGIAEFLEAEGFGIFEGNKVYAIQMNELLQFNIAKRIGNIAMKPDVNPIARLMRRERSLLQAFLYQKTGTLEFLQGNDDELSIAAFEGGEPVGVIITDVSGSGELTVDLIYNSSDPVFMAALFNRFADELNTKDRLNDTLYFVLMNDKIESFLQALVENDESFLPSRQLQRAVWSEQE